MNKLIIFVNGYTYGCKPFEAYWTEKGNQFLNKANEFVGGNATFYFINGEGAWFSSAKKRYQKGVDFVKNKLDLVFDELIKMNELFFVSHSMGSAFAEGMLSELNKLNCSINKVIHFSVADAQSISIDSNTSSIKRIQLSIAGDKTISRIANPFTSRRNLKIPMVDFYGEMAVDVLYLHPNVSKLDQLQWDFHYDTKTYGYVWDYVTLIEQNDFSFSPITEVKSHKFLFFFKRKIYYKLKTKRNDLVFKYLFHKGFMYCLENEKELIYSV